MPDAYGEATYDEWVAAGKPHPPPHSYKEVLLRETAYKHSIRRLVETGLGWGRMVRPTVKDFDEIISIERDQELYRKGVEEFGDDLSVRLFHGDSSVLLAGIILELDGSVLFWLDAHGADGSPVLSELSTILSRGKVGDGDVVMVDDLRCFGIEPGWPLLEEVQKTIREYRPEWVMKMEYDVLTAHRSTNGENCTVDQK